MRLASLKWFCEQKKNNYIVSANPFKYSAQVIGVNFTKVKREIDGAFDNGIADTPLQKRIKVTIG
jgi:hypothetical protein